MPDRALFVDYRLKVVRFTLLVSWAGLIGFALASVDQRDYQDPQVWIPLASLGVILVGLSVFPWRRFLSRPIGDWFLGLWTLSMFAGVLAGETIRPDAPLVAAYVVVILFAAAVLLPELVVAGAAVVAVAGYIYALDRSAVDPTLVEFGLRIGAFVLAAFFIVVLARGIRRELRRAAEQLRTIEAREAEVDAKEEELDRFYAVSRTIGVGSNLAEVLPELVGRVVGAVDAKVGLILLYQADEEALEVMSPIWVAGHTLRAEGYLLALTEVGITQRVFTSGEPMIVNDLSGSPLRDSLLADLDTEKVAAVPLRIESRIIGVLLVADKAGADFDREDLEMLESLAGPSALVLNQMSRYEAAKETGEKMAELVQLKTDFVSVVSHELRTPLTSIIGSLRTLSRPELAPSDPNARELLATADRQANRLRTLIEDLLVVSRIDNQALPVRPEAIDVPEFVRDAVRGIPEADRRVLIDISPDVAKLEADPDHLRRIITNLIDNALKYAPGSSIEVQARTNGVEVWLSVVDHGAGIPYELHEHIFDPFTQVGRHETRSAGGTGLGLSIVRGLSEAMGGRVWFEPTVGGGATFTVALPRTPRSMAPRQPTPKASTPL